MTRFPSALLIALMALAPLNAAEARLHVRRVVDGDTLLLSNKERVRLIGVDTPEWHESAKLHKDAERTHRDAQTIQALGERAARFVSEVLDHREVRLVKDPT